MKRVKEKHIWKSLNNMITAVDSMPLWIVGLLLFAVVFIPLFLLGEDCVFPIHDQLDETIMCYVLNARYPGTGTEVFPELLGGVNRSGMQPSAVLFILLYRLFPVLYAFLTQYAVVFLSGFFGMYLAVKEVTGSSILAVAMAGCFCMLPVQPVYGLSVMGVPLLLWCFFNFRSRRRIFLSLLLTAFFGLTTHLVLIGYVVLGFWALAILYSLFKKQYNKWVYLGFSLLTGIYMIVNRSLFYELFFGGGDYVSHREELVNGASPFGDTVKSVFLNSAQHADSLHKYLILPIFLVLILGAVFYKRMDEGRKHRYIAAVSGMVILAGIALFYGVCNGRLVVDLKNSCSGFLRYFQPERFYWLYPAGWYLEFGLCFSLWWGEDGQKAGLLRQPLIKLAVLVLVLLPTLQLIKVNSYFYMNVNQYNNGSRITGYISWESYYAEALMQELEDAIGEDMSTYRIAHLGISPAPALMHGFYIVDGYSNNYPLEYKHRFRRVIERELEKSPETAVYFDTWGSRCYLFNSETGNAWMLGKNQKIVYRNLELNTDALKELGCDYIFSCGKIENASEMGMELMGYYETEESFWGVWLYQL